MAKEEIASELALYLVNNWETLLAGTIGVLASFIVGIWFVAKFWYKRDLNHLENKCEMLEETSKKEIAYLKTQIHHKEKYAEGIMEVMSQRILNAKEEPQRLQHIIEEQEDLLTKYQKENSKINQNTTFIEKQNFFISHSDKTFIDSFFLNLINKHYIEDERAQTCIDFYTLSKNSSSSEKEKLSSTLGIIIILFKIQEEKTMELTLELNKNQLELNIEYSNIFKFVKEILRPLTNKETQKDSYLNILKKYVLNKEKKVYNIYPTSKEKKKK